MSVFDDFQRMWLMRFPNNSLSNEWEEDVKASLSRHKIKIVELTKELEQEMLYVEYLERLLSDVEKYKNEGGDATAFTKAAQVTTTTSSTTTTTAISGDIDGSEDGKTNTGAVGGGATVTTNDSRNEVCIIKHEWKEEEEEDKYKTMPLINSHNMHITSHIIVLLLLLLFVRA